MTGLAATEIRGLNRQQQVLLDGWHRTVEGDDDGRPWLPPAIRRMSIEERLALATDRHLERAWIARERERVAADVAYFIDGYGHVKDEDAAGPPVPFALWPEQREVLQLLEVELRLVILKARQLGLTWLALHYGFHLQALNPATPSALILGLSQDGGYAKRLLERARRINSLLPPYLRLVEERETRGSKSEFKLEGRGKMISLAGTKDAPRSHQATFAICDEWAFVRNGQAGPTMRALLPAAHQIAAISSGNGPSEEKGWGQHFAQLYQRAASGESEWVDVFLPTSTHPDRTDEWRAGEQADFDTDEEFYSEHPETPDEALIGAGKDRYFTIAQMNAIVKLGAALDELMGTPEMPPPAGEMLIPGIDWGEHAFGLVIWPLEGGGIYVPPSEVAPRNVEPGEATDQMHARWLEDVQGIDPDTGRLGPLFAPARYDAAGVQSMRTYLAVARARHSAQYAGEVRSKKVAFSRYKTDTAGYLRRLARRAGNGRTTGILAISPRNPDLIRQMRALESEGQVWAKDDDQHGPDALIAGGTPIARSHRARKGD